MGRNVFLSVLGTGYYSPTKYFYKDKNSAFETRFIQEAAIRHYCKDWTNNDCAIIFLTKDAKKVNWNNPAQMDCKNKEPYEGLSSLLENSGLSVKIETYPIPDGKDEKEIWEIFQVVFNNLKEGDKVYLDITHAFRSIPMLIMVLINYAKFLLKIQIIKITYGNHQAEDSGYSPVIDLTSFSILQDWTNGINTFLQNGDAHLIKQLLESDENQNVVNPGIVKQFAKKLNEFSELFSTVRGREIIEGKVFNSLFSQILTMKRKVNISQLTPLLDKLNNEISQFKTTKDISNGINAIEWCNNHNLYQQSITLLQEIIVSIFVERYSEAFEYTTDIIKKERLKNDDKSNPKKIPREYAGSLLGIVGTSNALEVNRKGYAGKEIIKDKTEMLLSEGFCQDYGELYQCITKFRNSINHGGMIDTIPSTDFEINATEFYHKLKQLISKYKVPCS